VSERAGRLSLLCPVFVHWLVALARCAVITVFRRDRLLCRINQFALEKCVKNITLNCDANAILPLGLGSRNTQWTYQVILIARLYNLDMPGKNFVNVAGSVFIRMPTSW